MTLPIVSQVRDLVRRDFGVDLAGIDPVAGGLDDADVWRAETVEGDRYAVKWSASGTAAGLIVPAALAEAGCDGVATPLPARDGRPSSEHDGRRLSVSAWADGPDGWSTTPLGPGHWSALGRVLRAAHDLTVDAGLAETLPRETYDPSGWVERCGEVDAGLGVPAGPSGSGDDDLLVTVRRSWAGARGRIISARDVVTDVGRRLRSRSHRPVDVVCHGDAHGGNLILRGDGRVVLLDWDDAVLAPVERDLMFVRSPRIWYATPTYGEHHAAFAAGYGGQTDPDPEVLTYYRCLRALEDVVDLVTWVLDPCRTRAERAAAAGFVPDVIATGGQLDVALGVA